MALTDGLVSYWKLDETTGNAADSVGLNTLTNPDATTYPGLQGVTYSHQKINNGAVFSYNPGTSRGSVLFIKDTEHSGLDLSESFTVSGWLKMTTLPLNPGGIVEMMFSKDSAYGLYFTQNSGHYEIIFFVRSSGSTVLTRATYDSLQVDTWYHVVAIKDGTTPRIYVNNELLTLSNNTFPATVDTTTGWFKLGCFLTQSFLLGSLDEVGVWNRALSQEEVAFLYSGGNGTQYPFKLSNTIPTFQRQ